MQDSVENRLKTTVYVVEATSFEQHCLWNQFASDSCNNYKGYPKVKWEQLHGWYVNVGKIGKRECWVSMSFARINGQLIMFYYPTSQVSDSVQTEKWIGQHFNGKWDNNLRSAFGDADNFHNCLLAMKVNDCYDAIVKALALPLPK
jgi:hypothetical protein